MTKNDLPLIYSIGCSVPEFRVDNEGGFWKMDDLERWIESSKDLAIVAVEDKEIVGFLLASYHEPSRKLTIDNIYVIEKHRGKGCQKVL